MTLARGIFLLSTKQAWNAPAMAVNKIDSIDSTSLDMFDKSKESRILTCVSIKTPLDDASNHTITRSSHLTISRRSRARTVARRARRPGGTELSELKDRTRSEKKSIITEIIRGRARQRQKERNSRYRGVRGEFRRIPGKPQEWVSRGQEKKIRRDRDSSRR